ncbi:hypothetical protein JCM10908_006680 [Rhodotorula pacifica]|uniref:uncharacterized protein n=1 Tax=Rhodotorula pacifica TaxID=1495444 RepID=UPI003170993F
MSASSFEDKHDLVAEDVEARQAHEQGLHPASSAQVPPVQTRKDEVPPAYTIEPQTGVRKVEIVNRVWGRNSKIALAVGIALASYIYSLDGTTTYQYQAYATSSFAQHSLLGAIATAQAIVLAVTKPFAAKFADVLGRAEAFALSVFFYVLGYIIIAACKNISTYAAGAVIYYVGYAALQILIQIVIADCTTLRWRGLLSNLPSIWFYVNAFVSGNIAQGVLDTSNWHWGYGMFCILIPTTLAPVIGTLLWAQIRAKRLGLSATDYDEQHGGTRVAAQEKRSLGSKLLSWAIDIDALGLILFGAGWACVLLPLTLTNKNTLTWSSYKIIVLFVIGGCTLIAFLAYERFLAKKPLFPFRFFKSYTVVACAVIPLLDFISFYLQFTYQYSFIAVTKDWSIKHQGYFGYTQTLSLTLFAIIAGFWQLYFRRAKWLLVVGLLIRLLGVGLMIHSKGAHGTTGELVVVQIIQGAGGGIAAACTQLLAQASVTHQDVAGVTALVLLFAEIGNAIGTAIASAIWRDWMPKELAKNLSGILSTTEIDAVYGAITTAASYRSTNPAAYEGIVDAYTTTMKILLIAATAVAVVPPVLALFVQNLYLSDSQNATEDEDPAGRPAHPRVVDAEKKEAQLA